MPLRRARPLSRPESRSADRTALLGREPSDRVRALAEIGRLTRSNTKAGTVGRRAVDAVVYRRRVAGRGAGVTARTAAGHEVRSARAITAMSTLLDGPPRWAVLEDLSRGERVRQARYDAMLSNLSTGDMRGATFRRRVSQWAPIRGEKFLADPAAALAILEERREAGDPLYIYKGRRS